MDNVLDLKDAQPGVTEEDPDQTQEDGQDSNPPGIPQTISWRAHHTLSDAARRRHYIVMAVIAALGGIIAFWQSSLLAMITILLGLGVWELRERLAHPLEVTLDDRGLWVDGQHHPYSELASFDIHQMPDDAVELSIRPDRAYRPHIRLPITDQDPGIVHALLSQYVVYDRHPIPLIDRHIRKS